MGVDDEQSPPPPPDAWLSHTDRTVVANTAMAAGLEVLTALSTSREESGDLVGSGRCAWCASMHKSVEPRSEAFHDLLFRASDLLERADDKDILDFEY